MVTQRDEATSSGRALVEAKASEVARLEAALLAATEQHTASLEAQRTSSEAQLTEVQVAAAAAEVAAARQEAADSRAEAAAAWEVGLINYSIARELRA